MFNSYNKIEMSYHTYDVTSGHAATAAAAAAAATTLC